MPKTPHLDRVKSPEDLRSLSVKELKKVAEELRAETVDAVSETGGPPGRRPWRGRADGRPPPRLRHPEGPPDLGRRPPVLPAQDHHWAARQDPHHPSAGRPLRLHQADRERVRPLRCRALLHLDLCRPRHGGGERADGRGAQRHLRHRRRRHVGRHGLRGDEQRRLDAAPPHRHPQRQRDVDRAGGGRAQRLPLAAALEPPVPQPARARQAVGAAAAQGDGRRRDAGRGVFPRHGHRRHPLRGAGLLLYRADRRPQSRPSGAGAAQRAQGRDAGAGAAPRRHQQGQGLRAGGERAGPRPRARQVRRGDGGAEEGQGQGAEATPPCSPRA